MKNNKFINTLKVIPNFPGDKERQVEAAYNDILKEYFPDIQISNPYKCDGFFETEINGKKTRIICEYKYNYDFSNKVIRSQVLAQVLFYLKHFEKDGKPFPNVILIGDINECFVLHANDLLKWLDFENIDWNLPASSAGNIADLVTALANDDSRNAFVFDIKDGFDFKDVYNKICDYATNVTRLIRITEHNVDKVFEVFEKIIKDKVSANDMVALFFGCITNTDDYFLHPSKKNTLIANGKTIRINSDQFKAFMRHFSSSYSPKEKARLASISDRLIEDTNRRRKGEFYTPTIFIDYAHGMISKQFGENWKDEYVVWDCACGTKNLTRDYHFNELYCSTLENAELEISKQYNPEAISFQFDFLNDSFEKLPPRLLEALKQNKKILFLINPPYGSGSGLHSDEHSTGTHLTLIRNEMEKNKIGGRSSNLYTQFLYRISLISEKFNLSNCNITVFCPPTFLTGQNYKSFRNYYLQRFKFLDGIQFDSSYFSDVTFGSILFSIWKNGKTTSEIITSIVKDSDDEIIEEYKKQIYNTDSINPMNNWFRTNNKINNEVPTFKNAMTIIETNHKNSSNSIGYFYAHGNNIFQSPQRTGIFSSGFYMSQGTSIDMSNFNQCITAFSARLLCNKNVYNQFDEFIAPNENHNKWNEFVNDSIIYSLFHGKSQQSSLRQIDYHNKKWDIKNNFFWMSKSEIEQLANDNNLDELYQDAHTSNERFVYNKLQIIQLSPEAKAVYDKACELVRKSMKYRMLFDEEHPEYQLTKCWDAGWYQIKAMLKQYMPNELKEFKELQKKLADKMRPLVYELGFLKK